MKKLVISLICHFMVHSSGICQGTLYTFILVDDLNCKSCKTDYRNFKEASFLISEAIGLKNQTLSFLLSEQVTEAFIIQEITKLNISSDDKIIFYSSGHAACESKNKRIIIKDFDDWEIINLDIINRNLLKKNAKFNMFVIDGCGDNPGSKADENKVSLSPLSENEKGNINQLFSCDEHTKTIIDIKSSTCGQKSYGDVPLGGYFTATFLNMLLRKTDNWLTLENLVIKNTEHLVFKKTGKAQTPIFHLSPNCK